jgi:hypothetical protein
MDLEAALGALEQSPLAVAMRQSLWLYPIVEITHIAGFVLLVGAVAMFDLRLLGFSSSTSVRALNRSLLPWAWVALLLIVPSGVAMFSAHAAEFAENPAFRVKLVLLAAAGINAALFHNGVFRSVSTWDQHVGTPGAARASAALSLLIWLGVITCGRLIAYL